MTPFAQLVEAVHPGAGGRTIVKLLDGRAQRTTVLNWKAGRCGAPLWAIDLLKTKLRQRYERDMAIANRVTPGPGLKAGAINLARYRQRSA